MVGYTWYTYHIEGVSKTQGSQIHISVKSYSCSLLAATPGTLKKIEARPAPSIVTYFTAAIAE